MPLEQNQCDRYIFKPSSLVLSCTSTPSTEFSIIMHSVHEETVVPHNYRRSASRLTILAHLFGILAFILMLVWLLHYRGGIEYGSYDGSRVFNVHPFLMFSGFIFLSGEAMMVYKTVQATHMVQKVVHMMFQLGAFVLGVVGLCAVFKFHDMSNVEDVYSLHSWIGIATITLVDIVYGSSTGDDKAQHASVAHLRRPYIAIHVDSGSAHGVDGEGYVPATAK
ncbi:putative transmembrane ascorbate ferrireductase 3 [Hibiscus syriacus]|uniref:Transmembrane ascorbate ferrireductase 3 n=1 Tax=Hibiscus syriacus TaxID=106335 RepID=A0A6A2WZC2_HIBSY|nr:putative transmembrane ascorbate ferrireductase 3 [Hibiscus syriacus]